MIYLGLCVHVCTILCSELEQNAMIHLRSLVATKLTE